MTNGIYSTLRAQSGVGNRLRYGLGMAFAAALLLPVAQSSLAQSGDTVTQSAEEIAAAVAAIAAQVKAEIMRLPATSTVEEYEASILFVVDQSTQPPPVICKAFEQLKLDTTIPENAKFAMDNVCRSLAKRRGTGAIPNGSNSFGNSGFSAPIISIGGGSSNYSQ